MLKKEIEDSEAVEKVPRFDIIMSATGTREKCGDQVVVGKLDRWKKDLFVF
ncbi:MAG: hypothetical protein WBC05_21455 [Sedimentisphaerales bacterium]